MVVSHVAALRPPSSAHFSSTASGLARGGQDQEGKMFAARYLQEVFCVLLLLFLCSVCSVCLCWLYTCVLYPCLIPNT
jgi:hypothetical protein